MIGPVILNEAKDLSFDFARFHSDKDTLSLALALD